METLAWNLAGQTRREKRDGREFIVAPVSMIVPGVLNGSGGALFYPADEVRKSVDAWNGMPLTLGHPLARNGTFPSARTPEVMDKQGLGTLYNTRFVNGKLAADAWFDINRLAMVDNRVLSSLQKGTPIELSTGLFTENEDASEGSHHEGTPYAKIARNYRPDHLAILLDQKGACSIADGCGVLNAGNVMHGVTGTTNGHQHSVDIFSDEGFGRAGKSTESDHVHFIQDFKVQEADGHTHTLDKSELVDTGIQNTSQQGESPMDEKQRKEIIKGLVENSCCHDAESRDMLTAIDDRHLVKLKEHADLSATRELAFNAATETFTDDAGSEHAWNAKTKAWETKPKEESVENEYKGQKGGKGKAPVVNEDKPLTDEEYMESLPPKIRQTIQNAQGIEQREKDELIAKLVANAAGEDKAIHAERLQNRSLEDLRADLALMPQKKETPIPIYAGGGGSETPVVNDQSRFAYFGTPDQYIKNSDN